LRILEAGVDHDLQAPLVIGDREQPADLGARPLPAQLEEAAGERGADDADQEGQVAARPHPSLVLIADEIRAQQNAPVSDRPVPKSRRLSDFAGWRLPASARKAGRRSGVASVTLASIAVAVSPFWVPTFGSVPRDAVRMGSAPREAPIAAMPDKPRSPPPEAPVEKRETLRVAPEQPIATPAPVASPSPQRVATRNTTTVRIQPEMAAPAARTLPARVILIVFRKKDDWLEVGSTNAWGWVHSSFVYPYDPPGG
jgi:hypothetical protein